MNISPIVHLSKELLKKESLSTGELQNVLGLKLTSENIKKSNKYTTFYSVKGSGENSIEIIEFRRSNDKDKISLITIYLKDNELDVSDFITEEEQKNAPFNIIPEINSVSSTHTDPCSRNEITLKHILGSEHITEITINYN